MKKMMNKVMATMIMVLTAAAPAMAGKNKHFKADKKHNATVVVDKRHYAKADKKVGHFDTRRAYHPDMKICSIKLSRYDSPSKIMARAERLYGVKNTRYNPHTRTVSVLYDAKMTSVRNIKRHII